MHTCVVSMHFIIDSPMALIFFFYIPVHKGQSCIVKPNLLFQTSLWGVRLILVMQIISGCGCTECILGAGLTLCLHHSVITQCDFGQV